MTTTFDERERAFERRFVHEEDMRFRVRNRRNRLLATWACERLQLSGTIASDYVDAFAQDGVVVTDEALVERLQADLKGAGIEDTLPKLWRELERCAARARAEQKVGAALDQRPSP